MGGLLVLGGYSLYSWIQVQPPELPDKLVVGLDYVPPALVGGAKSRTSDAIDAQVVDALAAKLGVSVDIVGTRDSNAQPGQSYGGMIASAYYWAWLIWVLLLCLVRLVFPWAMLLNPWLSCALILISCSGSM